MPLEKNMAHELFSRRLVEILVEEGFSGACGVPCSYFASVLEEMELQSDFTYVNSVNEGDAVATACGAFLGGEKWSLFLQNSGLGNALNPLTSLAIPYQIPLLLFISWRGDPEHPTEPSHHQLMGKNLVEFLKLMNIPVFVLDEMTLKEALNLYRKEKKTVALLIRKGTFETSKSKESFQAQPKKGKAAAPNSSSYFTQEEILRSLIENKAPDTLLFTTTGYIGRSLCALKDDPSHFYMMGSMGCVSSLALGVALVKPDRQVIVLDGDGALLMRAGALAVIGALKPPNFFHLLLNNHSYESTGGQKTVAETVHFTVLAQAMDYPEATTLSSLEEFAHAIKNGKGVLKFMEILTKERQGSPPPRIPLLPPQITQRLVDYVR